MALKVQIHVTLFGLVTSIKFYKAKFILEDLQNTMVWKKCPPVPSQITCEALMESEWEEFIAYQKQKICGRMWNFRDNVLVFCNEKPVGGFKELCIWCERIYKYSQKPYPVDFFKSSLNAMRGLLQATNLFVYLDIVYRKECIGRMIFELFTSIAPKTCENFCALCTGEYGEETSLTPLHYKKTVIHRIVPNGWIQGGDILSGTGNSGKSIYGITFEDENLVVPHNRRGVLGMANEGRPNTNGSQFYITLAPTKWMNGKLLAFGQMTSGCEVLRMLEQIPTVNERPTRTVRIGNCGVCTMKDFDLNDLTLEETAIYLPSHQDTLDIPIEISLPTTCKTSQQSGTLLEESCSFHSTCSLAANKEISDGRSSITTSKTSITETMGNASKVSELSD